MSEDFDPLTTSGEVQLGSLRSIALWMLAVTCLMAVIAFAVKGTAFSIGILFGGALSYGNFVWLDRSTRAIFTGEALTSTGILAAKYILRYVLLGAIVLLIYATGVLPVVAVILGLTVFAAAVVLEGIKNIFSGSI